VVAFDLDTLAGHGREGLRRDALAIAAHALAAVDPVAAAERLLRLEGDVLHVGGDDLRPVGP
jgi:hypothetical protein